MNKTELIRELRDKLVYVKFSDREGIVSGILHHVGRETYRIGDNLKFNVNDITRFNMRVPMLWVKKEGDNESQTN